MRATSHPTVRASALTVSLLALPLGLLVGLVLGALGGGGSVLAVPALIYLLGQDPVQATTGSLLIVLATSVAGVASHSGAGHVDWRTGVGVGLAGVAGAIGGSLLAERISRQVLLTGFAILVLIAAATMWREAGRSKLRRRRPRSRSLWSTLLRALVVGTLIGVLTGLFGVGGGFVAVPALVLGLGMDMALAVGTSLVVIAINSVASLLVRLGGSLEVQWQVVLPFAAAGVVGAFIGERGARKVSNRLLQRSFAVLLVGLAGFLLAEQFLVR
ncbi:hypothetical protein FHU38_000524 [Saccharomonospora amisosensis]|uniref:Probable membrane transporter protein n=1 Tax=Saccharomonospora amisosensis TaxID=1128677 RepID=A0A7X5ZPF4_9PSEU|nr:sulfite exporter TauE/SafE family protein [Saccharomonospora amisosensis]NIJ10180.1 hypothetical protein [Saccharomonospora amisosensis]